MTPIDTNIDAQPASPTRLVALTTVGICVVLAGALFVLARQWGWTLG